MHGPFRFGLLLLTVVMAACSSGTAEPSPSPDGGGEQGYRLRATLEQAIPPVDRFSWMPMVTITEDLVWVSQGPVPAIYPGPLVAPLIGRQLSDAGYRAIVTEARSLGLLEGSGEFTPDDVLPGVALGRLEIEVDGDMRELLGDPSRVIQCIQAPCDPAPGTPEAFASFWQYVTNVSSTLEGELGPESPYQASAFALLITTPVAGEDGLPPRLAEWPLDESLAETGRPVGQGVLPRCAVVSGPDARTLQEAFGAADQLTNWVDPDGDPTDAVFIHVRQQLDGEDVCVELFGPAE